LDYQLIRKRRQLFGFAAGTRPSTTRSPPGSTTEMPITPNQTGTSPPKTSALNSSIYTLRS